MSRIRGSRTGPEEKLAPLLARWLPGVAIIRNSGQVFGRPDFWIPALNLAVFVDGCFFHGCPKHYTVPADNAAYWRKKKLANQRRDRLVNRTLRDQGIQVLRIWEHELKGKTPVGKDRIRRRLRARQKSAPSPLLAAEERAGYGAEPRSS